MFTVAGADPQFLRDGLRLLRQELVEAEVTEAIGAAPYEPTDKRVTVRNGVREREWDTRLPSPQAGMAIADRPLKQLLAQPLRPAHPRVA
jgi:hypothetical protein